MDEPPDTGHLKQGILKDSLAVQRSKNLEDLLRHFRWLHALARHRSRAKTLEQAEKNDDDIRDFLGEIYTATNCQSLMHFTLHPQAFMFFRNPQECP